MTLIPSTNPSRAYAVIDSVPATPIDALPDIVARAHKAQKSWTRLTVSERVIHLERAYTVLEGEKESLAQMVALEMGMPIRQARDEVAYGLLYFRWYLDHAEEYLSDVVTRETDTELHIVSYEAKGVIAAITPWNYPCMLFVWACIQPLLAGNTVIWKISKETILTGQLIAKTLEKAKLPEGVWSEVYGGGEIGDALTDLGIDGITFTGSTRVGRMLQEKAEKKGIKSVMELGGSAPGIVCADADIDTVIESIYFFRYSNSGQMCDGLKRLIVHASRYDEVVEKLSALMMTKKIGDASDELTDVGPLVSQAQLENLERQYNDALASGASVLARTPMPAGLDGAYFSPTLLGDITTEMSVWREEVFGPILPIIRYESYDEAISLANDTEYGLGAYVFTEDEALFRKIAKDLETSMVQMNTLNYCYPENPFGGRKASGIGSEHGRWGYTEFTDMKVISIPKK